MKIPSNYHRSVSEWRQVLAWLKFAWQNGQETILYGDAPAKKKRVKPSAAGRVRFETLQIGERFYTGYGTVHQRTFEKLEYDGKFNARETTLGGLTHFPDSYLIRKV